MTNLAERDALLSSLCGQHWPHEPLLKAMTLPRAADVLDLGAGKGALLAWLQNQRHTGARIGLDRHPAPGVQPGHAEALPFPEAHFDAVFLVRVLLHLDDPATALAEALRVLRTGGQLIVAVQGADHLAGFWAAYGPPSPGADALTAQQLTGLVFERLDVRLPIALSPEDAADIARSYVLPPPGWRGTRADQVHLAVFVHRKGPRSDREGQQKSPAEPGLG